MYLTARFYVDGRYEVVDVNFCCH